MIKTSMKKLKFLCVALCLFFCLFCGCGRAKEQAPQPADKEQSADGGQSSQTANPTKISPKLTKVPTPTKTMEEKIAEQIAQTGYPTASLPREFVPGEGQTELVLWNPPTGLDEYILAELNHILQERQYSFYLTVKSEPPSETHVAPLARWQEIFDAGEAVDLIYCMSSLPLSIRTYGKTDVERMITGGYLLPFSAYPDTPAKERLRAAYREEYWRLCSVGGEIYGISNGLFLEAKGKNYLLLNLDVAEQAGIEAPETLDLLHLDGLLWEAEAAGISGIRTNGGIARACGIELLSCGLYVKHLPNGEYCFVNPFEDGEFLEACDAMNRYNENGWIVKKREEIPSLLYVSSMGNRSYLEGDRFVLRDSRTIGGKEQMARVRVYGEGNGVHVEGDLPDILGIAAASRHKEEAAELLCLMHTDEEIVRLLRYGIEGIHYRLGEDGLEEVKTAEVTIVDEHAWSVGVRTRTYPGEESSIGNIMLHLELDEAAGRNNREDGYYGDIGGIGLIPYVGDLLAGKEEQLEKIRDVLYVSENGDVNVYNLEGLWRKKRELYQKELDRMRAVLEEAGYNALIAELNQGLGVSCRGF